MASLSFKIAIWQAHKQGKCIFFYYIALFLAETSGFDSPILFESSSVDFYQCLYYPMIGNI